MKRLISVALFLFWFWSMPMEFALPQPVSTSTNRTVMANTNGLITAPTNFFEANSNTIISVSGVGGKLSTNGGTGTNLTLYVTNGWWTNATRVETKTNTVWNYFCFTNGATANYFLKTDASGVASWDSITNHVGSAALSSASDFIYSVSNMVGGVPIYTNIGDNVFGFKSLSNGAGVAIVDAGDYLIISNTASAGEANAGSNLSDTAGQIYVGKSGVNLEFKSIAVSNLLLETNGTNILIMNTNSTAPGAVWWPMTNRTWLDEFVYSSALSGDGYWTVQYAGTSANAGPANDANGNQWGIGSFISGTTTGGYARIYSKNFAPYPTNATVSDEFKIKVNNLSYTTSEWYYLVVGWSDTITDEPATGVYIIYDPSLGTNWIAGSAKASTRTRTDSGVPVTAGQWVVFRIVCNPSMSNVNYYVNGALFATHTNNKPLITDTAYMVFQMIRKTTNTAGTNSLSTSIDYWSREARINP